MLRNLLIYRLALFNFLMFAVLGVFFSKGYVQYVFANDHSGVSYLISGLFLIGLVGTFHRAGKTSKAHNDLKDGNSPDWDDVEKMPIKNGYLHTIMNSLTGLGILGTTIGMATMLSEVDGMDVSQLIHGASIAFMCTLLGIGTAIWTEFNVRMLDTATNLLVKDAS